MDDRFIANHEAGLEISGIRISQGEHLRVGFDGVQSIMPVPIAGSGGWMYWLEVVQNDDVALFNPLQLLSVEYTFRRV